jgi:predicted HTH transcriptional regulator
MQLNLLDYTPPITVAPHRGVDTSIEIAKKIGPSIKDKQQKVLDALADFGPQTTESLAQTTGMDERTVQPRTSELKSSGVIVAHTRTQNSRGNSVSVWHLRHQVRGGH